jgi:hypothetical protein
MLPDAAVKEGMNMKNSFRSSGRGLPRIVFCLVLGLLLCPAFAPVTALAENVTYNAGDPLQNIPGPWGGPYNSSVAPSGSAGGQSPSLSGNMVTVNGGTPDNVFGAVNTLDSAAVTGNQVIINGGDVSQYVAGGIAENNSGSATANNNTVTISGGTVGIDVYGAWAWSDSGSATATGNSVFIGDGTVQGNVHGGFAQSNTGAATASGNSVFIGGNAQVDGNVFGGSAFSNGSGTATATNNTVTISGSPTFGANVWLIGGQASGGADNEQFTGNTLNLWNTNGITVDSVYSRP